MDNVQTRVSVLVFVAWLAGCMGPHDTVLMADEPVSASSTGGSGGAPATSGGGSSGMTGSMSSPSSSSSGSRAADSGGSSGGTAMMPTSGTGNSSPPPRGGSGGGSAGSGGSLGSAGDDTNGESAGSGGMAGGDGGDKPIAGATDADCDFNGVWAAQQLTVSQALELAQTSNNWYLLEIKQTGDDVVVSNSFDCGIEVRGSATVTLTKATLQGELPHNHQDGRKGTLKKVDGKCVLDVERFWSIRGADEMRFLPGNVRNSMMNIVDVAKALPLPTTTMTDGAIDTEGDGKLGIAFQAMGIISGTRNSVQRDWTRWFTGSGFEIMPSADWSKDITAAADFDNEESVIDATSDLLRSPSSPKTGAKHQIRLRFLGRDRSDARAMAMIKSNDVDTCYAIQDALPATQLE